MATIDLRFGVSTAHASGLGTVAGSLTIDLQRLTQAAWVATGQAWTTPGGDADGTIWDSCTITSRSSRTPWRTVAASSHAALSPCDCLSPVPRQAARWFTRFRSFSHLRIIQWVFSRLRPSIPWPECSTAQREAELQRAELEHNYFYFCESAARGETPPDLYRLPADLKALGKTEDDLRADVKLVKQFNAAVADACGGLDRRQAELEVEVKEASEKDTGGANGAARRSRSEARCSPARVGGERV